MNESILPIRKTNRIGFTLIELLAVIVIIAILLALLMPSMRFSREAARRMSCSNSFKQLGLALHNYHSAYGHLPSAMGGTDGGNDPMLGNMNRLSGLVALLPYIEQQETWERISMQTDFGGVSYPLMGPAPWISKYDPWREEISIFRCPSASTERVDFGLTNYTFCIGDVAEQIHQPQHQRGMFACRMTTDFKDITDGLSNTIAMTEIGTQVDRSVVGQFAIHRSTDVLANPSLCLNTVDSENPLLYATDVPLDGQGRGGRWADGAAGFSLVNTILPPNGPSCAVGGMHAVDGIYSAGSYHAGGCHVLMADGAVKYFSEGVDTGDLSRSPPTPDQLANEQVVSPYGIWGALGTAAGDATTVENTE